ncbi:hypothetical protein BDN70DRAFT_923335 [Pholiota conissans]|uniref:Mtf2-like C-terminal domain-containing protein n=1 Tax=Pholiota conissans TaxID=109636 RepID=A0A9P5YYK2_9AGAR|nr:hypothetical protein BDN70DRAFT_923335 [Pholiota conissans]
MPRCQLPVRLLKTASTSILGCSHPRALDKVSYHSNMARTAGQSTGTASSQHHLKYQRDIDESSAHTHTKHRSRENSAMASESAPRQTMTERESKVLTDMLDMIFASHEDPGPSFAAKEIPEPQAGVGPVHVDDLFRRLRRLSTRKPTSKARAATAEMFDLKKEEMNQCKTDQELLAWAAKEVFEESVRYEKAAKQVADEAVKEGTRQQNAPPLQSPIYPLMIAYLMKTFRDHYHDPNLALYIFKYAQKLSIVSYTFGCSTDSYNELIETRWACFKDLQGVLDALNEMSVNAIPANSQTHTLVDRIRRDFGADDSIDQTENSMLLMSIEDTLSRMAGGKTVYHTTLGAWKNTVAEDDKGGFDDWSSNALLNFNPKMRQRHRNR